VIPASTMAATTIPAIQLFVFRMFSSLLNVSARLVWLPNAVELETVSYRKLLWPVGSLFLQCIPTAGIIFP
jgi:hypothetical protein